MKIKRNEEPVRINLSDNDIVEIYKITKPNVSLSLMYGNILHINIDEIFHEKDGQTYNDITINKLKNNRYLVTAQKQIVFSAAEILSYLEVEIELGDKDELFKILTKDYGINTNDFTLNKIDYSEDYSVQLEGYIPVFTTQKLITEFKTPEFFDVNNFVLSTSEPLNFVINRIK